MEWDQGDVEQRTVRWRWVRQPNAKSGRTADRAEWRLAKRLCQRQSEQVV